jgi:hypothetical protein
MCQPGARSLLPTAGRLFRGGTQHNSFLRSAIGDLFSGVEMGYAASGYRKRGVGSWRGDTTDNGAASMMTLSRLAAESLEKLLGSFMRRRYDESSARVLESATRTAMECIGNSDALYHDIEHTMLVTLAAHAILSGRHLHTHLSAEDYIHILIACLAHDIGYVRGLFKEDDEDGFVVDEVGTKVSLQRGASDASLMNYHVDRSKLYVMQRLAGVPGLDHERIASAIEGTRFPARAGQDYDEDASILRAADFIGQLGDPNYLRKANALYYEFEEVGINRQLGYDSPADIVNRYPQFYWDSVAPHIQTEIGYLNQTEIGRQWIANLYSNVFRAERDITLSGPQK